MLNLDGYFCWLLEYVIYRLPEPPPRVRTKPMEVLCVGFPRSGTESLQHALLTLGYDYTYHGWDILFEKPIRCHKWVQLARKKWFGTLDGNYHISTAEFDEILGHSVAVTDAAGSCFASDLIEAYPEAKVILNTRKDLDTWYESCVKNIGSTSEQWLIYALIWFNPHFFWMWHVYVRFLWPRLFRCTDGDLSKGIKRNGKWVYREHSNMIRGLVAKDRLLEWQVEDGWPSLCNFLNKDIPSEPFPHVNDPAGFQGQIDKLIATNFRKAILNMALVTIGSAGVVAALVYSWYLGR